MVDSLDAVQRVVLAPAVEAAQRVLQQAIRDDAELADLFHRLVGDSTGQVHAELRRQNQEVPAECPGTIGRGPPDPACGEKESSLFWEPRCRALVRKLGELDLNREAAALHEAIEQGPERALAVVEAIREISAAVRGNDPEQAKVEGGPTAKITREEANLRAREALKNRPPRGKKRWTQRTLAKAVGCADGMVSRLPAWQAYAADRGLTRREPAAPKAVSLTEAVLAKEGREDGEELQRLTGQQAADDKAERRGHRQRKRV